MVHEIFPFIGYYLTGLALNLTPCVYPMLAVTVSLFGAQKEKESAQKISRWPRATSYVLGMATMYSALGASASLTGGLFGAWLSNRWVLAGAGLLMLLLAFSMFGLYELQLPQGLLTRLSRRRGTGILGMYLAGLGVGIFAAPCIGPPVVALLTLVSAKGSALYGFLAFFVMSLGLGTPYWILGTFSGALEKLPRSGMWLVWVERLFGVVLVAMAVYFFVLAFTPKSLRWVLPVALILGGLYLGFVEKAGSDKTLFKKLKWGFGVLVILAGLALVVQAPGKISALVWEPYDAQKLQAYRASGQPVVLDFYADWCLPCHEMDEKTFTDSGVIKALEPYKKMRVDVTHFNAAQTRDSVDRFNVAGVPTLIFFGEDGEEVTASRTVGFVPPKKFLEIISQNTGFPLPRE
ncbi:MAG: thioredoxin fold domain-containing protein [Candidatus Omnitrophica bacterium]|nr:thioredoxin fold domain-containing protein [Candidatus Omnitrophota bacterium]